MEDQGARKTILKLRLFLPLIFGLSGLYGFLVIARGARAAVQAYEGALNPEGAAYEINPDDQGILWISDYGAGEIWGVITSTWTYTIYPLPENSAPSDARRVDDDLWWADYFTNTLGHVSTGDSAFEIWRVPGSTGLSGTGVDSQGRVWALDVFISALYRLDPLNKELCTYTIPQAGWSGYLLVDGGTIWLVDWKLKRLLSLPVNGNTFLWWELPYDSSPVGMALDGQGNLWYADSSLRELVRLNPNANQMLRYYPPETQPQMLTLAGERVWYTGGMNEGVGAFPSVGVLNPLIAYHTVFTPTKGTSSVDPICIDRNPEPQGNLTPEHGEMAQSQVSYPTLAEADGWLAYLLPHQFPEISSPWGIAAAQGKAWFVDTDRHVLGSLSATGEITPGLQVYLPLVTR